MRKPGGGGTEPYGFLGKEKKRRSDGVDSVQEEGE